LTYLNKSYTVKLVYSGQPRVITKVAFVDRWPLFRNNRFMQK